MPEYVTDEALAAMLGPAAPAERVALSVAAANELVEQWCPQAPDDTDPAVPVPAPVTAITTQAALELAHGLYRAHASIGGVFAVEELLARLPADRVRPIRDLLDAATHRWGMA